MFTGLAGEWEKGVKSAMTLGQRLRTLRKAKGLTLSEVSERTGISCAYLSSLERGQQDNPSFKCLIRLTEVYGLSSVTDLVGERSFPSRMPQARAGMAINTLPANDAAGVAALNGTTPCQAGRTKQVMSIVEMLNQMNEDELEMIRRVISALGGQAKLGDEVSFKSLVQEISAVLSMPSVGSADHVIYEWSGWVYWTSKRVRLRLRMTGKAYVATLEPPDESLVDELARVFGYSYNVKYRCQEARPDLDESSITYEWYTEEMSKNEKFARLLALSNNPGISVLEQNVGRMANLSTSSLA